MSSVNRNYADDGRQLRSIILDVPRQRDGDGWAPAQRPGQTDARQPDAQPHSRQLLDISQLDRLVVDVATEPTLLSIGDLFSWTHETRRNLFRVVAEMQSPYTLRQGSDGQLHSDMFELVISLMEGTEDVSRCEAGRQAACEAAAYFHGEAVLPSANRIVSRLRELGVQGVRVGEVQREIQAIVDALQSQQSINQQRVLSALPDAPVNAACVIAARWQLSRQGIMRMPGGQVISPPIVIVGRLAGINGRSDSLQLSWYRDGRWNGCMAARPQISTTSKIQTLAARGLPVDMTNARFLVQYLHDFFEVNSGNIPVARASNHLGWHDDELDAFVLPAQVVTDHETFNVPDIATRRPDNFTADSVIFAPASQLADDLTRGVYCSGSYRGWLSAIAPIAAFPKVQFCFYASLAAPLLRILNAPNFVLDLCGMTSRGKTSAAAIGASAWGKPVENVHDSFLHSWDSTAAFREEALATVDGVPLFLDETRLAERESDVVRTVYSVVKGRRRGRTHNSSMGRSGLGGSSTVLISTGEVPISDLSQKGGVRARIIPLWGCPFGTTSREINQTIQSLMAGIRENFGFAGPLVVRNLLEHREQWNWLRVEYQRRRNELADRAGDRPAVGRLSAPLAAISIAAWLAHESLNLAWPLVDPVDLLWDELTDEAQDADRAQAALEHAVNWAIAHKRSFFDQADESRSQPLGGWAGRWDDRGQWLGFMPVRLRSVLRAGGFEFDSTIKNWCELGWILVDTFSGKKRHRARIRNEIAWLVAIRREVIDRIFGGANL